MAYAPSSRSLVRLVSVGMLLVLAASPAATADDPPEQAPPAPTPTPVPGTLAAAAAGLRLQAPAGTDSGALVITNQNLKATGAGAAVSQGGAAAVAPGPGPSAPQGAAAANDLAAQLLEQQARVDDLTVRLQAMDEQLAAPSTDPHFPKVDNAPQFRAPGVVDPARGERDALAAQLEAERAKLDALRAQAATAGVTITKAPNEAPTPTS
jgi:hypothetical protein